MGICPPTHYFLLENTAVSILKDYIRPLKQSLKITHIRQRLITTVRSMSKALLHNFIISVQDGQPAFTSDTQRGLFNKFLSQFEGKKVWMTLDTRLPKRSDRQNRFYWLYLEVISREKGYFPEELHTMFKQQFLAIGQKQVLGVNIIATRSTTDLNKLEFGEYLAKIESLTEVPIPDVSIFELAPLRG